MSNTELVKTVNKLSDAVHDLLIEIYARDQQFNEKTKEHHDELVKARQLIKQKSI